MILDKICYRCRFMEMNSKNIYLLFRWGIWRIHTSTLTLYVCVSIFCVVFCVLQKVMWGYPTLFMVCDFSVIHNLGFIYKSIFIDNTSAYCMIWYLDTRGLRTQDSSVALLSHSLFLIIISNNQISRGFTKT